MNVTNTNIVGDTGGGLVIESLNFISISINYITVTYILFMFGLKIRVTTNTYLIDLGVHIMERGICIKCETCGFQVDFSSLTDAGDTAFRFYILFT